LNFFVIPEHSQLARHLVEIDVSVGDETLRTDHPKLAEILTTLSGRIVLSLIPRNFILRLTRLMTASADTGVLAVDCGVYRFASMIVSPVPG
jgi:hypothetical protein